MNKKLSKLIPCLSLACLSTTVFIPSLTSCHKPDQIMDKLMRMPRVSSVSKDTALPGYKGRYNLYYTMPIDWTGVDKGTFELKVELNLRDFDAINQFYICGYETVEIEDTRLNDYEVARHYEGNLIRCEYRFFNTSRPKGLKNTDVEGWTHLTNAQATQDFHAVIESLKTLFTGKWVATGPSKGGESVNIWCMTYPTDCDAYVPYVAPTSFARDDGTLNKFIYETIGDDVFGTTQALAMRKTIAQFVYYLFSHKADLVEKVWNAGSGCTFSDYLTEHHEYLFDYCVQEFTVAFWQYNQSLDKVTEILNMTEGPDKVTAAGDLLLEINGPKQYAVSDLSFPYVIQAFREMGEYKYDFQDLIACLKNHGFGDITNMISVPAAEWSSFHWRALFTKAQYEAWHNKSQDMTLANSLKEWYKKCTAPVFMIYGKADPWIAYRLQVDEGETIGSGIREYFGKDASKVEGRSHKTRISTLTEEETLEIWTLLDLILYL